MKIGFFDSGLGGLTVLKAVASKLPEYSYYFYGDTEHLPYGDKSEEEIYQLVVAGVTYLFQHDCSLVILACNTASAETARRLQQEFLPANYPDRKVLGIIIPTLEELNFNEPTSVAMIATKRTVESKKYSKELKLKGNKFVDLIEIQTPELVPLIEKGHLDEATKIATDAINREAPEAKSVVLACTHYTQIKQRLRNAFVGEREVISQDEVVPSKLLQYLTNHPEIESLLTKDRGRTVHLTEHREDYDEIIKQFLGGTFIEE